MRKQIEAKFQYRWPNKIRTTRDLEIEREMTSQETEKNDAEIKIESARKKTPYLWAHARSKHRHWIFYHVFCVCCTWAFILRCVIGPSMNGWSSKRFYFCFDVWPRHTKFLTIQCLNRWNYETQSQFWLGDVFHTQRRRSRWKQRVPKPKKANLWTAIGN